jgi:hypothetical protein
VRERHIENRRVHQSASSWVVANTHRVEVGLYQNAGRWAVTWVVMTSEAKVLMFSPAEAKRLGQELVHLADEALSAEVP